MPMYRFTTDLAALAPAGPEQQALFGALADRPAEVDRFLGVLTGTVPIDSFLGPRNLLRLLGVRGMAAVALGRRRSRRRRLDRPAAPQLALAPGQDQP